MTTVFWALVMVGLFWWFGYLTGFWWWGVPIISLGVCLNMFVMWRNGGRMPVLTDEPVCNMGPDHTVIYAYTRHRWLGDIFTVRYGPEWRDGALAFRHRGKASLGDFLIWGGFAGMWGQPLYVGVMGLCAKLPW